MKALSKAALVAILAVSSTFTSADALANQPDTKAQQQLAKQIDISESININHASVEQLSALKGVGVKRAQAIVEYREQHGNFGSLEELLNVKGIGEKVLANNRTRLVI